MVQLHNFEIYKEKVELIFGHSSTLRLKYQIKAVRFQIDRIRF